MATYAPEFVAALRHRYEDTDQPLRLICAEFNIGLTSLYRLLQRGGWTLRTQRLRQLPPASRLIEDVIALADIVAAPAAAESKPHHPLVPAEAGTRSLPKNWIPAFAGMSGCGESAAAAAPIHANARDAALDRFEAFLLRRLDEQQAAYEQGAAAGNADAGERSARTVSILIRALHSLRELRGDKSRPENTNDDHDDMPADIDEFRRELARRIKALVDGQAEGDGAPADRPEGVART